MPDINTCSNTADVRLIMEIMGAWQFGDARTASELVRRAGASRMASLAPHLQRLGLTVCAYVMRDDGDSGAEPGRPRCAHA